MGARAGPIIACCRYADAQGHEVDVFFASMPAPGKKAGGWRRGAAPGYGMVVAIARAGRAGCAQRPLAGGDRAFAANQLQDR
jgi:hypothetical protein